MPQMRTAVSMVALLVLLACAGSSVPPAKRAAARAVPSEDWRDLLVAPFGSTRKDLHLALHEVFLFDEAPARSGAELEECYALGGSLPRLGGRRPDTYLLCFYHDRLARIEAAALLAADEAAKIFAQVCAHGLRQMTVLAPTPDSCEGREASVVFKATLTQESAQGTSPLSVSIYDEKQLPP